MQIIRFTAPKGESCNPQVERQDDATEHGPVQERDVPGLKSVKITDSSWKYKFGNSENPKTSTVAPASPEGVVGQTFSWMSYRRSHAKSLV